MTTAQSAIDTSSLHGQQRTSVRHPCAHTKRLDTKPGPDRIQRSCWKHARHQIPTCIHTANSLCAA